MQSGKHTEMWFVVQKSAGNGRAPLIGTDKVVGPVTSGSSLYQTYMAFVNAGTAEGPYPTKAKAQAALSKVGTGPHANGPQITNKGGNPLSGIDAVGNFFNNLGKSSTWLRVAKIVGGGALLLIGISHLTGMENKVGEVARNVPIPV